MYISQSKSVNRLHNSNIFKHGFQDKVLFTSSAVIRDTDEHEDVEEEVDDVGVDGEGGEGPVLGVVAVLVLPDHHHLRVHQQEHHLECVARI